MCLSPVFIRDELNDQLKDPLNEIAQSRPDVLYVSRIKTAILTIPRPSTRSIIKVEMQDLRHHITETPLGGLRDKG